MKWQKIRRKRNTMKMDMMLMRKPRRWEMQALKI
jgi:hypothetical protein